MHKGWIYNFCGNLSGILAGGAAGGLPGRRNGRGATAPRYSAELYPVAPAAAAAGRRPTGAGPALIALLCLMTLLAPASAAGFNIVNSARIFSNETPLASTSVVVATTSNIPPKIEFLTYAPLLADAVKEWVAPTSYRTGSDPAAPFAVMANPVPAGSSTPIDLTRPVPLTGTDVFHQCEPVFVRLTNRAGNLDPTRADSALVTVSDPASGETEVLRLTETGPDTGVFTGYIQSAGKACLTDPAPGTYSGLLPVTNESKITAQFTGSDGTQSAISVAIVDPYGILFDSVTGKPLDGATVTLLDGNGNPAVVFGDDGVSPFPATVVTGGTPRDDSGRLYAYPPGQFRFPFVRPGVYRFQVAPPPGYVVPSAASDASIQALPGGPFALALGSRLESFTVNPGPALNIDIPADPLPASLWLQKSAGKSVVATGDFLPYQLDLQNNDAAANAFRVSLTDTLPPGFRYQKGSTTVLGKSAADPALSADGRTLTFALGDLAPKGSTGIRYVVEVATGAAMGDAVNTATARSYGTVSNTARATVRVQSDFLAGRSLLMGRVARGPCDLDWDEGVEGLRIYLEDGTFVNTDRRGMFHFEGVKPGSHVVQLDLDSLPEGFEVYSCQENSRFAGRSFSQFVDVQGGTVWRTDFRVGRPEDAAIYEERIAKRREAAEEQARQITEERMLSVEKSRKTAEAAAEEEEEVTATEDWPATEAPAAASAAALEAPVDDWAEPVTTMQASAVLPGPTLELSSALEQGGVVFAPAIEVSRSPLKTQLLEVELPPGLVYRPGSATRDGSPMGDPSIRGRTLGFALGRAARDEKSSLRFATDFSADAPSGEYITRALLKYATEQGIAGRTTYADNILVRIKEEERDALPTMTVRPNFDTFEDRLSAEDKAMLDETILTIRLLNQRGLLKVRQLLLVGHTDNVRIAPRSRRVHRDNTALSMARARSVAVYLKEQLGLTPAQISASGKGESSPLTSNRTPEGRAVNRRVEVVILTEKVAERVNTLMKKDRSGVQSGGPAGASGRPAGGAGAGAPVPAGEAGAISPLFAEDAPQLTMPAAEGATAAAAVEAGNAAQWLPKAAPSPFATVPSAFSPRPMSLPASPDRPGVCLIPAAPLFDPAAPVAEPKPVKEEQHLTVEGILTPADGSSLPDPISAVRVVLDSRLTPKLTVDGVEIPADRIGFTLKDNTTEKTLYSYIGVDFGLPGAHTVTLIGKDPFGIVRLERTAKVTRVGAIALIRFARAEGNVADGKTPVRVKLEMFDAAGAPFRSATELQILEGTLKPLREANLFPDAVSEKKERVQVDADGYALFQPVSASGLYRVVLGAGKTTVEAETYVQPKMRDWILVGLGEGTVGYNAVSGHMENLRSSGTEEDLYQEGRIAFYGKGTVKGKWLATVAYDSAKARGYGENSLFQTIDPEATYTLYGDASQQLYDAASARKLYLKIERDQFYALFGDFDTGLTVTELSRYSRRLNGVKAEWQTGNMEATVFGADTAQAYARDEIRGDGTSGLYRLSQRNIVRNSEKITVQTRDRFRSEIVLNSRSAGRYVDYNIDYDTGALFFKDPIFSRDENFNPVYIVAEYETLNAGSQALSYGGRLGSKLFGNKLKTGFSYIHEGQVSGEGNSYGLDAAFKLGADTTLKAEASRTDADFGGSAREGSAWLAELQHQTPELQGKLYFREQEAGFGLGQQNGSETGTRKLGVDARYKFSEAFSLGGQGYRQYNLATGAVQDIVEAKASTVVGPYNGHVGLRHAADRLGDGTVRDTQQLTWGGSWLTFDKRLTLRVDHDQSVGGNSNADYPTRTVLGADLKATDKVSVFAQKEFTDGAGAKTDMTRLGLKAIPWTGGAVSSTVERDSNENGARLFALFGLQQSWKITEKWSVDGGVDRSQTVRNSRDYGFNVNVPPASGASEDFTAVSVGSSYTEKKWNWNNRVEYRNSASEDKWGVVSAFVGEPKEGWGWSSRLQMYDTRSGASSSVNDDLRLGLVYRPVNTRWIILDRLDLIYSSQKAPSSALESRRMVNNMNANFRPNRKSEISLQYGAKYVLETIDGAKYSGYTDLVGVEGRYDVTKEWDIGARCSLLHSWGPGQISYGTGLSLGYNVVRNAWVSLGYNLLGFNDKDFSAADYTAQGPFLRFRFKFDQNSVKDAVKWVNQ